VEAVAEMGEVSCPLLARLCWHLWLRWWHGESYQEIYLAENESIFIFLANFQRDHFPDLTHRVAAQTVVLAHRGMRKRQRGGARQLPPRGSPHFSKSKLVVERHLKLRLLLW